MLLTITTSSTGWGSGAGTWTIDECRSPRAEVEGRLWMNDITFDDAEAKII